MRLETAILRPRTGAVAAWDSAEPRQSENRASITPSKYPPSTPRSAQKGAASPEFVPRPEDRWHWAQLAIRARPRAARQMCTVPLMDSAGPPRRLASLAIVRGGASSSTLQHRRFSTAKDSIMGPASLAGPSASRAAQTTGFPALRQRESWRSPDGVMPQPTRALQRGPPSATPSTTHARVSESEDNPHLSQKGARCRPPARR